MLPNEAEMLGVDVAGLLGGLGMNMGRLVSLG